MKKPKKLIENRPKSETWQCILIRGINKPSSSNNLVSHQSRWMNHSFEQSVGTACLSGHPILGPSVVSETGEYDIDVHFFTTLCGLRFTCHMMECPLVDYCEICETVLLSRNSTT